MRTLSLLVAMGLLAATPAHAKGKPKAKPAKAKAIDAASPLPKNPPRLRGATGVITVPGVGLHSTGGPTLRTLPNGASKWQTVHTVKGGHLYRVAGDARGRILASWEEEDVFHLFVPATKEHRTFPKPKPAPYPDKKHQPSVSVDELFFAESGTDAIVQMHHYDGHEWVVDAYRVPLDGKTAPTPLFRQGGYQLLATARLGLFATVRDPKKERCEHNFCALHQLVVWEIGAAGARSRVIFDAGQQKKQVGALHLVWGSDHTRVAVVLDQRKGARDLLRWSPGDAHAELRALPKALRFNPDRHWMTASGEVLELWVVGDERTLDIWRFPLKGEQKTTQLPPLPLGADGYRPEFSVHGLKERKNGDLLLHWGDWLYVLPPAGPARRVAVAGYVKGNQEWAGAFLYMPDPEGLWIGIDGGGRGFIHLTLAEVDAAAQPLP